MATASLGHRPSASRVCSRHAGDESPSDVPGKFDGEFATLRLQHRHLPPRRPVSQRRSCPAGSARVGSARFRSVANATTVYPLRPFPAPTCHPVGDRIVESLRWPGRWEGAISVGRSGRCRHSCGRTPGPVQSSRTGKGWTVAGRAVPPDPSIAAAAWTCWARGGHEAPTRRQQGIAVDAKDGQMARDPRSQLTSSMPRGRCPVDLR